MNQLWVRISLTYVAIAIFLFLVPTAVFLAVQADNISVDPGAAQTASQDFNPHGFLSDAYNNLVGADRLAIVARSLRLLLAISLVGILIGTISSIGLTAPLHNLAVAARAVGSQDLSQRIKVRGSSEVREVAEAFNSMAEALQEADKLRSNMLTDITHELRTPLTVIQGNLRAILDDVYELDKVEVARLYDQTRQLSRLVDDLHDLALLEADRFSLALTRFSLAEIVHRTADIYQPLFEDQGVKLSLALAEGLPLVEGDSARLTQCLNNLLTNALRHTSPGGEVRISLADAGGRVVLSVVDNGSGIEAVHLPHVFDRFYRVDPDRNRQTGGSGLGLAITQALVRAHGGEITAASPGRDRGSEFTIYLPPAS